VTPPSSITVATYNIHSCVGLDGVRDRHRVLSVLQEIGADIIGLQEVRNIGSARHEQFTFLPEAIGMHCAAGVCSRLHRGQYGNLLLSRWPILQHRFVDLGVPGRERRGAIDAVIDIAGRPLRVIVTHLGLIPDEQLRQVNRLAGILREEPDVPLVIMGDFNLWGPQRMLLRRIGATRLRKFALPSFPSWSPVIALDRIWSLPSAMVEYRRVHRTPLSSQASDHLPVVAGLRLDGVSVQPVTELPTTRRARILARLPGNRRGARITAGQKHVPAGRGEG
jgi:endonuclease/exonuclease/phosphatase family metal-dependent hydrolase